MDKDKFDKSIRSTELEFDQAGFSREYNCKAYLTDANGREITDPITRQPKFHFDLSDPFTCPFSPDAICVFADKIYNEDDNETLDQ